MTSFKNMKLGDIASVISGYAFKSGEFGGEGIPVIKIANIRVGSVNLSDCAKVSLEYLPRINQKYQVNPGDILISLTGSHLTQPNSVVGRVAQMPFNAPQCLLNQRAGKIINKNEEKCNSGYLYRYLSLASQRGDIAVMASGAASQANVSPTQVESLTIKLPALCIQQRITAILSTYDNLIENNLRRIKILEEMAQNLYREWFIKFCLPGHEQVRMVDSRLGEIPEGWEVATLGQYLSELESGKRPKGGVGNLTNGIPSVGAENVIGIGMHNCQREKFVSREFFEGMKKGTAKNGDVALYKDGAYIGRSTYFRDGFPHGEFCVNEHVFLLRSTGQRLTQNLLYLWMKENSTISAIRATNANAAQPGINQKGVKGLQLVVPTEQIALQFDELIDPYLALIVSLAKRNNVLRETRDLLLPKLISGELNVSKLDIETRQKVA